MDKGLKTLWCTVRYKGSRSVPGTPGKALDPNTDATGRADSVYWFTGLVCKSKGDKGHSQCQSQTFKQIQRGWGTTTKSKTTSKNTRSTGKRQEQGTAGACSKLTTIGGETGASQREGRQCDPGETPESHRGEKFQFSVIWSLTSSLSLSCCPERTT